MPLVYPPNFEGVRLTYEYIGAYFQMDDQDPYPWDASQLTTVTGNATQVDVGPETCFFYFEESIYQVLFVRGFVNTSVVDSVTVRKNNNNATYYMAYVGTIREYDEVFLTLACRMVLSETFSAPIKIRVNLEMVASFDNNRVSWKNVPEVATLGFDQNGN